MGTRSMASKKRKKDRTKTEKDCMFREEKRQQRQRKFMGYKKRKRKTELKQRWRQSAWPVRVLEWHFSRRLQLFAK